VENGCPAEWWRSSIADPIRPAGLAHPGAEQSPNLLVTYQEALERGLTVRCGHTGLTDPAVMEVRR
jgi:hypothetical protein